MKSMKFYLLLLVLPCLALECDPDGPNGNNDDDNAKPTYYMSQEFKDYVLFPERSWWVYENRVGQVDTIKIIWQETTITDPHNFNSKVESFQHHLNSSFYNDTLYGGGKARFEGGDPIAYNRGMKYATSYLFFTAKDTGEVYYHSTKEVKYLKNKDTLNVNGNIYTQIRIFKTLEKSYRIQPHRIYWAKNVGIIKKVLFDSTIWKLRSYHINK